MACPQSLCSDSAIPLAHLAGTGLYLSMAKAHKIDSRWMVVGEVALWVFYYFCAVWIFNALLPPKPEQTPFETYMKDRMWQQSGDRPDRDEGSLDQNRHSRTHQRQQ